MRLIDADTLIKNLSYLYTKNHIPVDMRAKEILTTIMEQPTAYDVDKVVEELLALNKNYNDGINLYEEVAEIPTEEAVEIVKCGIVSDVCEKVE